MKDKKVVVLIVLSVFAVISLARGIMAPAKHRHGGAPPHEQQPQLQRQEPAQGLSMTRRAKRSTFAAWKRNPFVPGYAASTSMTLSGVIWNKDRPKAMIGDTIVTKGDKVCGATVVEIKPDSVILNDGSKNIEIKLEK
jgi:hypothetical protein